MIRKTEKKDGKSHMHMSWNPLVWIGNLISIFADSPEDTLKHNDEPSEQKDDEPIDDE